MKYEDLRIGNLVEYEGEFYKIHSIAKVFPTLDTIRFGIGVIDWDNIKPITLTTEWLIKLGFENWGEKICNEYEKYDRWVLHNVVDGTSNFEVHIIHSTYGGVYHKEICFSIDDDERQFIHNTDFIHNLQNTYYLCVGHELYHTQAVG